MGLKVEKNGPSQRRADGEKEEGGERDDKPENPPRKPVHASHATRNTSITLTGPEC